MTLDNPIYLNLTQVASYGKLRKTGEWELK